MVLFCVAVILACAVDIDAGPGGSVFLINLSGSDWKLTHRETHGLNAWKFPSTLKAGDTSQVYVEFSYKSRKSDYGRADYELVGTEGKSFQIWAHGSPNSIEVVYTNFEIDGQPKGLKRDLGWRHDADTNIIIIMKNGKYTGTGLDGSNWMSRNIGWLGNRSLKQISIPGSHDAGMSRMEGHTAFGNACNCLTQSKSIKGQLEAGVRYFDIRPVIGNGGDFLTGHYSHIKGSFQGANGQSIASIITDINEFTKGRKEVIIISLSHSYNTDVGANSYRPFHQSEWEELFKKFDTVNDLYHTNNINVNIAKLTLNDLTNKGSKSGILIIVDGKEAQLGKRMGKGYFLPKNINVYDNYANTNDWSKMVDDQMKKMKLYSKDHLFLISWTLTQSSLEAAMCVSQDQILSVKSLAEKANEHLGHLLYNAVSKTAFPNIILVDNVKHTDVTELALAVTSKVYS